MGAINEVDEKHMAMISGYRTVSEGFYFEHIVELWLLDAMETIEHCFSIMSTFISGTDGESRVYEGYNTMENDSKRFLAILGLDPEMMIDGGVYGAEIPESEIKGREIGVLVGEGYGRRQVTGFYAVSELSTMAVVD